MRANIKFKLRKISDFLIPRSKILPYFSKSCSINYLVKELKNDKQIEKLIKNYKFNKSSQDFKLDKKIKEPLLKLYFSSNKVNKIITNNFNNNRIVISDNLSTLIKRSKKKQIYK